MFVQRVDSALIRRSNNIYFIIDMKNVSGLLTYLYAVWDEFEGGMNGVKAQCV